MPFPPSSFLHTPCLKQCRSTRQGHPRIPHPLGLLHPLTFERPLRPPALTTNRALLMVCYTCPPCSPVLFSQRYGPEHTYARLKTCISHAQPWHPDPTTHSHHPPRGLGTFAWPPHVRSCQFHFHPPPLGPGRRTMFDFPFSPSTSGPGRRTMFRDATRYSAGRSIHMRNLSSRDWERGAGEGVIWGLRGDSWLDPCLLAAATSHASSGQPPLQTAVSLSCFPRAASETVTSTWHFPLLGIAGLPPPRFPHLLLVRRSKRDTTAVLL